MRCFPKGWLLWSVLAMPVLGAGCAMECVTSQDCGDEEVCSDQVCHRVGASGTPSRASPPGATGGPTTTGTPSAPPDVPLAVQDPFLHGQVVSPTMSGKVDGLDLGELPIPARPWSAANDTVCLILSVDTQPPASAGTGGAPTTTAPATYGGEAVTRATLRMHVMFDLLAPTLELGTWQDIPRNQFWALVEVETTNTQVALWGSESVPSQIHVERVGTGFRYAVRTAMGRSPVPAENSQELGFTVLP